MKLKRLTINKRAFDTFAVIIAVLGMGSLYFQVLRMPLMAALEIGVSVIYLILHRGKFPKHNFFVYSGITLLFVLTSILNYKNGFYINDLIIWIVNWFFVSSLQASMKFDSFVKDYVKVMTIEALISLICFLWADILGGSLPFMTTGSNIANSYYLTPYFTRGWGNIPYFHRNAGCFTEPGAHQIFLNFALMFLLSDDKHLGFKRTNYISAVIILMVAIISAQSTTGYMCLAVVLAALLVKKDNENQNKHSRKWIRVVAVLLMVFLFIVESQTRVVESKLTGISTGQGSGRTRYNDTVYGYYIASISPIIGHGMYMSNMRSLLLQYGIINISNGMASFAIRAGFIITFGWLVAIYIGMRKRYNNNGALFVLLMWLLFFLCVNAEGLFLNILFLCFIGKWQGEKATNWIGAVRHE